MRSIDRLNVAFDSL